VDGGYKSGFLNDAAGHGSTFDVVQKQPDQKGFTALRRLRGRITGQTSGRPWPSVRYGRPVAPGGLRHLI
jgi:hypothetical protein